LRLAEQLISFFAVLLWIGGALALLAGLPELGWAIFAVILVNGVFSFFQEYRAERAMFKLPESGNERARVPRLERTELLFAGSSIVSGEATGVVVATGMATEIGAVCHLTQAVAERPSSLQREMRRVTRVVTILSVAIGAGCFVVGVATGLLPVGEGFVFALGMIVANVPEGLLPTLTLALALSAQRMARRRSIVKRLSAVEGLGATTVICTDKTGTLTEGRMLRPTTAIRRRWPSWWPPSTPASSPAACGQHRPC
jgi:magnesium-transporting ATPase (P-type)